MKCVCCGRKIDGKLGKDSKGQLIVKMDKHVCPERFNVSHYSQDKEPSEPSFDERLNAGFRMNELGELPLF